jgi:hypothetical protein
MKKLEQQPSISFSHGQIFTHAVVAYPSRIGLVSHLQACEKDLVVLVKRFSKNQGKD